MPDAGTCNAYHCALECAKGFIVSTLDDARIVGELDTDLDTNSFHEDDIWN